MTLVFVGRSGTREHPAALILNDQFGVNLISFGQRFEIPDSEVRHVIGDGGAHVVSVEQFDAAGFTTEELKRLATPVGFDGASADLKAKIAEVQEAVTPHKVEEE